ncbi:hypothetical protein DRN67_00650 [Candidatus Micrarchaeota archaeon]|nr:MAG: hypothetical protein DRN67_00650 [Candidatus Micrarchaeota archaeon]
MAAAVRERQWFQTYKTQMAEYLRYLIKRHGSFENFPTCLQRYFFTGAVAGMRAYGIQPPQGKREADRILLRMRRHMRHREPFGETIMTTQEAKMRKWLDGQGWLSATRRSVADNIWKSRENRIKATRYLVNEVLKPSDVRLVCSEDFAGNGLQALLTQCKHSSAYYALLEAGLVTEADKAYMTRRGPRGSLPPRIQESSARPYSMHLSHHHAQEDA